MEQQELTPEAALKNLDNLAAGAQGNRDFHMVMSMSVAVLQQVITEWQQLKEGSTTGESKERAS